MSKQPRKQRKALYTAPLHKRHNSMSVHLSDDLKEEFNRRSFPVRKGDSVEIVRGDFRGTEGKVEGVDPVSYTHLIPTDEYFLKTLICFLTNFLLWKNYQYSCQIAVWPNQKIQK